MTGHCCKQCWTFHPPCCLLQEPGGREERGGGRAGGDTGGPTPDATPGHGGAAGGGGRKERERGGSAVDRERGRGAGGGGEGGREEREWSREPPAPRWVLGPAVDVSDPSICHVTTMCGCGCLLVSILVLLGHGQEWWCRSEGRGSCLGCTVTLHAA